jgi:hypothetical protein
MSLFFLSTFYISAVSGITIFFNAVSGTVSFKCFGNIYNFPFVVRLLNAISSAGVCLSLSGFSRYIKNCDIWAGVALYKLSLATSKIYIITISFWVWQPAISQVVTKVLENVFTWILGVKLNFFTALVTTSQNNLCHNPQYHSLEFRSYSSISLKFCNLCSTFIKPDSTQKVAESHLTPDVNMLPVMLCDVLPPCVWHWRKCLETWWKRIKSHENAAAICYRCKGFSWL